MPASWVPRRGPDGTVQATYNGWPLYYYAKDKQPGDTTGQDVGKVWYVIAPSGDAVNKICNFFTVRSNRTERMRSVLFVFHRWLAGA